MARQSKQGVATTRKSSVQTAKLSNEPVLGDSWVVDDDRSSLGDETDLITDEDEDDQPKPSPPLARIRTTSRVHTGTAESAIFPGRTSPQTEFKMPVLEHDKSPSKARQRKPATMKPSRPQTVRRESHTPEVAASVAKTALEYVQQVLLYFLDILGMALKGLKTPLSWLVMVYLGAGLITIVANVATRNIYSALSPVCNFPGVSFLDLPFCDYDSITKYGSEPPPPEFDRLMESQEKFEDILASTAVGVTLPADMKRSEAAIRDLRTLVRYSSLKSRNELALEFDGFIETARMASADLQKFNSHTGRAADSIISTARWTMRTLDDVNEYQASRGALQVFFSDTLLAPFQPKKMTPALVLDQYVEHTRKVEFEINQLLEEAQALLLILQNLEERLDIIHDISVRDGQVANVAKDELLGQLWTILGGNKSELRKYNSQLMLLQEVGRYRQTAWAHVSTTVLKLQAMNAELEELRERVGSTELLMDRKDLPLSVHLEAIQMGVERLEIGRHSMKEAQANYYDRAMHRGKDELDGGLAATVKGKLIDS